MNKIDFVITWVDGSDPEWLKEKNQYNPTKENDASKSRYRDWGLLKYWFRGVEKYAPWVNKIYFVTWGHIPSWLNTNHPKLVIINHKDYIPKEYLPTFNSNTIEIFMHQIPNLSQNFVYFNDDMFLTNNTRVEDFFCKELPCDSAILTAIIANGKKDSFSHCLLSDMNFINKSFSMRNVIKKNINKWFNIKYGIEQIRTLLLLPWNNFPGIKMTHLPISYQKKTFKTVWEKAKQELTETANDRFRNNMHVNHWIFQNWQQVTGNFHPRSTNFGKLFIIENSNKELIKAIEGKKYKCICLNDANENINFEKVRLEISEAFEKKLPVKSSYEK